MLIRFSEFGRSEKSLNRKIRRNSKAKTEHRIYVVLNYLAVFEKKNEVLKYVSNSGGEKEEIFEKLKVIKRGSLKLQNAPNKIFKL